MAEIDLATVNAAIAALVANPEVDYTIGDKSVKASQKLAQLLVIRKELMANPQSDINIMAFDALDIDEFGADSSQEIL